MHPTITGLAPDQGADALDERFEQLDYIRQDDLEQDDADTTPADDVATATTRATPHIVPKIAPPKATRRYGATELPDVGVWVVVTVQNGSRKETFHGRVAIADTSRIRLKHGAGWWEIPIGTIVGITAGDDPAHRGC